MQTFRKNVEDMSLLFLLKYFENSPYMGAPCITNSQRVIKNSVETC